MPTDDQFSFVLTNMLFWGVIFLFLLLCCWPLICTADWWCFDQDTWGGCVCARAGTERLRARGSTRSANFARLNVGFSALCPKWWFICCCRCICTFLCIRVCTLHLSFHLSFFVFEISTNSFMSPITVNALLPKLLAVRPGDVWFERFARLTSLSVSLLFEHFARMTSLSLSLSMWFERFAPQMMTSLSLSLLFECLTSQHTSYLSFFLLGQNFGLGFYFGPENDHRWWFWMQKIDFWRPNPKTETMFCLQHSPNMVWCRCRFWRQRS